MTYYPRRDHRFEYFHEAAEFVEDRQCSTCAFKSDRPEYPICGDIELLLMEGKPVVEWTDLGNQGLTCNKYRNEELVEQEHPDQGKLF